MGLRSVARAAGLKQASQISTASPPRTGSRSFSYGILLQFNGARCTGIGGIGLSGSIASSTERSAGVRSCICSALRALRAHASPCPWQLGVKRCEKRTLVSVGFLSGSYKVPKGCRQEVLQVAGDQAQFRVQDLDGNLIMRSAGSCFAASLSRANACDPDSNMKRHKGQDPCMLHVTGLFLRDRDPSLIPSPFGVRTASSHMEVFVQSLRSLAVLSQPSLVQIVGSNFLESLGARHRASRHQDRQHHGYFAFFRAPNQS